MKVNGKKPEGEIMRDSEMEYFLAECRDTRTNGGSATKSVFVALALRVNPAKGPVCHPSVPTIARDASVHVRTVQRALKRLAVDGFITIEHRQRRLDGGKVATISSEYTVIPRADSDGPTWDDWRAHAI